jgi:hypothetical protein
LEHLATEGLINPILVVPLQGRYVEKQLNGIKSFLNDKSNMDGSGTSYPYYVKTSYATNRMGNKKAKDFEGVIRALKSTKDERGHFLEEAFVQHTVFDNKEYKVVCMDGKAMYIASFGFHNKARKIETPSLSNEEAFGFAEKAISVLQENCPSAMVDGIVRVDIMVLQSGRMVVNELESLEAGVGTKSETLMNELNRFRSAYWLSKIEGLLSAALALTSRKRKASP